VEFRMKTGCHGTAIAGHHRTFSRSGLPRQIVNKFRLCCDVKIGGDGISVD
jgi:hypothetical protein